MSERQGARVAALAAYADESGGAIDVRVWWPEDWDEIVSVLR